MRIKDELLRHFNLHTVVRLPKGVFSPYTDIATNILFFDSSGPTGAVWFYEHQARDGRKNYTKTQPITYEELAPCLSWWGDREEHDFAWRVSASSLLDSGCNLDVRNPRAKQGLEQLAPADLIARLQTRERQILELLADVGRAFGGDDA